MDKPEGRERERRKEEKLGGEKFPTSHRRENELEVMSFAKKEHAEAAAAAFNNINNN